MGGHEDTGLLCLPPLVHLPSSHWLAAVSRHPEGSDARPSQGGWVELTPRTQLFSWPVPTYPKGEAAGLEPAPLGLPPAQPGPGGHPQDAGRPGGRSQPHAAWASGRAGLLLEG